LCAYRSDSAAVNSESSTLTPRESNAGAGIVAAQQFRSNKSRRGKPSKLDSAIFVMVERIMLASANSRLK
jgi:hypothetical protein